MEFKNKKMTNIKQFYKELGRLLYAVAMADGKIQKEEEKTLHDFVCKELALSEPTSDSSGMNQAFYTDFEFADYVRQNISIEEAHDSFMRFFSANAADIDPILIYKSIRAVEKLAGSFKKINQKERDLIDRIKKEILEITEVF
jgi:hypothetical protein